MIASSISRTLPSRLKRREEVVNQLLDPNPLSSVEGWCNSKSLLHSWRWLTKSQQMKLNLSRRASVQSLSQRETRVNRWHSNLETRNTIWMEYASDWMPEPKALLKVSRARKTSKSKEIEQAPWAQCRTSAHLTTMQSTRQSLWSLVVVANSEVLVKIEAAIIRAHLLKA